MVSSSSAPINWVFGGPDAKAAIRAAIAASSCATYASGVGMLTARPVYDGGSGDGACRDRTGDLRLAKPALSQLS